MTSVHGRNEGEEGARGIMRRADTGRVFGALQRVREPDRELKRQARESLVDVFSGDGGRRDAQHGTEVKEPYEKKGEDTVEKDLSSEAFGR